LIKKQSAKLSTDYQSMKTPLIDKTTAERLITKHGSPLYVYRKEVVKSRYCELVDAIIYPKAKIYYACKANTNIEILKLLKNLGSSIECVSRGEVVRALQVGFTKDRIAYTCSNIPKNEIVWLVKQGISAHLDSLTQLEWWGEINPGSEVSLRINRGFGAGATSHIITGGPESKFGIYYTDISTAKRIAKKYKLTIVGLEQHIGSSILMPNPFARAVKLLLESAKGFRDLRYLDFGGGLGIPYKPDQNRLDISTLGAKMSAVFSTFCKSYSKDLELRLEPGRYIVAESGALLTEVVDIKQTPKYKFVGVNSGFSHLVRPAFYGSYHHIFNLSNLNGKSEVVHIAGNLCESSDVFAKGRLLPKARIGDLLLIADAGAYGYPMSSDYNLRPKPKEVVID
jgi:diaminopimelate decarboxylase